MTRRLLRRRRLGRRRRRTFAIPHDELYTLTMDFCAADTLALRTRRASLLFSTIWSIPAERAFVIRLLRWIRLLEQDGDLRARFQHSWSSMLEDLNCVLLFTDSGLPGHHALFPEILRRLFQRLLPSAREISDAGRLFTYVFSSPRSVDRFTGQSPFVFDRLLDLLRPVPGSAAAARIRQDLSQAMCLLATRVAGRGVTAAIRQRGSTQLIEASPFYRLIFATERFVSPENPRSDRERLAEWESCSLSCRQELDQVHLHMEDAGVSAALVYDLRSIEATLERMRLLSTALVERSVEGPVPQRLPQRVLLETLVRGRLEDTRLSQVFQQNLNLLARKTVERTGHGGEHYIAHSRQDYWSMWRAAAGGGILTVFTAAIKMKVMEGHSSLFAEGFLVGTDYAVSFVLLQIFGLALATKQPSMTAATLAGIIRENRGVARWSKISDFAADISRTQLAAVFGNITAVCLGAVAFEEVWLGLFRTHYLPASSAEHVYQTLHPFTSGTAIFAAFTGVILWLAALIGGWCENFTVFHRIPEAIAQHPLGYRLGTRTMQRAADWLERNIANWSTSIVLGYLLGFSPVIAQFFGIPLDVRHVTLSTGTLALAAARFGTSSFGHGWLYYAIAGIGVTFVLNLGVSFSIASFVALRAYEVPRKEQLRILRFLFRECLQSPSKFIFPEPEVLSITPSAMVRPDLTPHSDR